MQLHPSFVQLVTIFTALIKWTDEEIEAFVSQLTIQRYRKGDFLLQPPQLGDKLFFVNAGFCKACMREKNGRERIIFFSAENEFIADMISFLSNTPMQSTIYCKVMQPAEVVIIPRTAINWIYENIAGGNKLGRLLYLEYGTSRMLDMYDAYIPDPMERFKKLLLKIPDIEQRVSQKIIASYLNITPEYLSGLKAKHKYL